MITTISTLPAVPNRNDPGTFSDKADSFLGAMPTLVSELNSFVSEVNTLSFKTACKCATTTNITLSGTQTIDGTNATSGDRVLVKNQNSASQNGIYIVSSNTWNRAADMDTAAEVAGSFVPVTFGVQNGGKIYYTTFNATGGVLGITDIPWNSLTEGSITGIGTLAVANGGTGISSYAVGDLIYASGTASLAKLAAAAAGNVLKSGTLPSWGKVDLATEVTGNLSPIRGGNSHSISIIQSTTSGTSKIFSINDYTKSFTVMFNGVLISLAQAILIRIGTFSGGIIASGYINPYSTITNTTAASGDSTTGIQIAIPALNSAVPIYGGVTFNLFDSTNNRWSVNGVVGGNLGSNRINQMMSGFTPSLPSFLDRVEILSLNSTFTAGSINILQH